jgi:hypothetical protein
MLGVARWPGSVVAPYKTLPKPVNGMATNPFGKKNPAGVIMSWSCPRCHRKFWAFSEYTKHHKTCRIVKQNPSRLYKARWGMAGQPDIANVSFEARSDYEAKLRADKIARELGVTHTPRTIQKSGGGMVECRMSGTSSNPRSCKMCGGPLVKMGGLGNLMWYRCRNCGMESSVKK